MLHLCRLELVARSPVLKLCPRSCIFACMQVLHLGSNNLTGTLPPSLSYSSGLQQVILTDNNMS